MAASRPDRCAINDVHPQRCFSTLGCGEQDLDAATEVARLHRIPCIELRTLGGTVDLPAYLASRFGSPDAFGAAARAMPARIASLGTSLRMVDGSSAARAAFLAYVPWALACGAQTLRVFDGGTLGNEEEIRQAGATWRWWQQLRAEARWSVDIVVETHDAFAVEGPLLRLLDALPQCRVLWDSHHTWRKGGTDPVRTWGLIRERVQHIHVKDSIADPRAKDGYRYVLPAEGEFPMQRLREALVRDAYAGVLSLEWERHWHPELPALELALRAATAKAWW